MKKLLGKVKIALLVVPMLALGFAFFAPNIASAKEGDTCTLTDSTEGIRDADNKCVSSSCNIDGGLSGALGCSEDAVSKAGGQTGSLFGNGSLVNTVINIMLFLVGILCVIFIIYGGIRYTISRGDKNEVEGAKNTLMYAIIGLIIAMIAYALVNWVFTSIGGGGTA